jgi:hypothetical protein
MNEENKKSFSVDITSKAAEKAIDLAKDFLDKLVMPAATEIGLLVQDPIKSWRFSRQIKMLIDAKEKCIKHGINPKEISVKLLCPLLDGASLEENDYLLDKWSTLLSNLVDPEQNIQNHVFPYTLSQMSITEFQTIEACFLKGEKTFEEKQIRMQFEHELQVLEHKKRAFDMHFLDRKYHIEQFEIENLIRLGILRQEIKYKYPEFDFDKTLGEITNIHITSLGYLFIQSCIDVKAN